MAEPFTRIENVDGIALITLARPPVNSMDLAVVEELERLLAELEASPDARALVITGDGDTFSAGLDLKALPRYTVREQDRFLTAINRLLLRLYGFPRPTVAAVNGSAVAGGLILVLACDYRLGLDTSARLGLSEVRVGAAYPVGALEVARAELSPTTARLLMLSGASFGTKAAVARGILDETEPLARLVTFALARAADLAAMPEGAYAAIKRQIRGAALERIRRAVEEGDEPLLGRWISDETAAAMTRSLLRGGELS